MLKRERRWLRQLEQKVVSLFPRLPTIIFLAQHLAIVGVSLSPFMPWCDVVAFHLLNLEVFLALDADTFLSLVRLASHIRTEGPDVEMLFSVSYTHLTLPTILRV